MVENIRILLIEHDQSEIDNIANLLRTNRRYKYDITNVGRLAQALKEVISSSYDIILLNPDLPDSQNFNALKEIKKLTPDVPVFALKIDRDYTADQLIDDGASGILKFSTGNVNQIISAIRQAIEHKTYEKRITHLNGVMRAIRNVNQLITKETDVEQLLQKVCDCLTGNRSYNYAWIGILNEDQKSAMLKYSHAGRKYAQFESNFKYGNWPNCWKQAMKSKDIVYIDDPSRKCNQCCLSEIKLYHSILTTKLSFENKIYGAMTISLPKDLATDPEEKELFKEVVDDISFALHRFELKAKKEEADMKLLESQAFLNNVIEQSPYPMWVSDGKGTLIKLNQSCRKLLNITDEEVVGKYNVFDDNIVAEQGHMDKVKAVFEKGEIAIFPLVYDSSRLDNVRLSKYRKVILDVKISPYRDKTGKITNAIVQHVDITERVAAEEALKESEKLYRLLADNTQDGIWLMNARLEFTYVNPSVETMLGYTPEEWIGSKLVDHCSRDDFKYIYRIIREGLKSRDKDYSVIFKSNLLHKDGHSVPVEITGRVIFEKGKLAGFQGTTRDITDRKRAEDALRLSEERFRNMAENSPVGLIVHSEQKIEYINPNALSIFGASNPEDIAGQSIYKFVHPEYYDLVKKRVIKVYSKKGNVDRITLKMIRLDGSVFWAESAGSMMDYKGAPAAQIVLSDVSDRIRDRERLAYQALLLQNVSDAIIATDKDYNISMFNKTAESYYGWREEEVIRRPLEEALPSRYIGYSEKEVNDILFARGHWNGEVVQKRKDGNEIACLSSMSIIINAKNEFTNLICVNHDITARKRAERAIHESEQKFRTITESTSVGIHVVDAEGLCQYVNPVWQKYTGLDSKKALGKGWLDGIHPDDRELISEKWQSMIDTGGKWDIEYRLINKNGQITWVWATATALKDESGEVTGYIIINIDVTQRRQAEQAMRETETKYQRLYESMRDAFVSVDMRGWISEYNAVYKNMLGYDDEELRKLTYVDLTPEKWHAKEREIINSQLLTRGYSDIYEKEYRRKDGSVFPVELRAYLVRDDAGEPRLMWAIVRDITERKKAEQELQQSERKFRNIVESLPLGVHMYKLEENGDLIFIGTNPAAGKILNVKLEDKYGMKIEEVFPGLVETDVPKIYKEIAAKGTKWFNEDVLYDSGKIKGAYEVHAFQTSTNKMVAMFLDITKRKKAEKRIKESEEKYRQLFNTAQEGIWVIDNNTKTIMVNESMARMLGYSVEEIIKKNITDFMDEEGIRIAREKIDRRRRGIKEQYDFQLIHKNGNRVYVTVETAPILDNEGNYKGSIAGMIDITEKKMAERQIKRERDRVRLYLDIAGVIIVALDTNGNIELINKKGCQILECCESEALNKNWFDTFLPQDNIEEVKKVFARLVSGEMKGVEYYENHIVTMKKKRRLIAWHNSFARDHNNNIVGIISSGNDITEQREAQQAVADEKERLAVTLRSIGDAVITTDTRGRIVLFNNIAEKMTGYTEAEATGKNLEEIFHIVNENTREKLENPVNLVMKRGVIVGLANHTILISKDGTERAIADSGAPIRNKQGKIIGVVLVFRDVTKSRSMQEIISRAQRLETAGKISGQIAHDFNNLLGPLIAYPQIMRDELPAKHPVRKYIDKIEDAASKIAEINQQLLTLGRRGHYNLEPLNMNDVIKQVLSNFPESRKSLEIVTKLQPNLFAINGGSSQIFRVLSNLVFNARDAITNTGQISIRSENFYADRIAEKFGRVPKGEYVKVTISDTGDGIPSDIRYKIFEPFFTTKKADKKRGTGLGLSIVLAVIEDHNGYIDLDSQKGKGTRFFLYFPITRDKVISRKSNNLIRGSGKILVVDDDPIQREVSKTLLNRLGYTAFEAESGEHALEMITTQKFDLILLDMVMPDGIDGAETYRRALEKEPSLKAVIVSGYAETDRVNEAIALGAFKYVRKPVDIVTLSQVVKEALAKNLVTV